MSERLNWCPRLQHEGGLARALRHHLRMSRGAKWIGVFYRGKVRRVTESKHRTRGGVGYNRLMKLRQRLRRGWK